MMSPLNAAMELVGQHLIEASAGTGKTHNISLLYVRLLLERQFSVRQIAVVTFSDAATRELRLRLRRQLVEAIAHLDGSSASNRPDLDAILGRHRTDVAACASARTASGSAGRIRRSTHFDFTQPVPAIAGRTRFRDRAAVLRA